MEQQITIQGTVMTVVLAGEIDHHSSEDIRDKVDRAFERSGCKHIIFDFTQVSFMDSSGIGMIIGRYKSTEKRGGMLSIAGMNDELKRIFQISGLAKIVRCHATVTEAEQAAVC